MGMLGYGLSPFLMMEQVTIFDISCFGVDTAFLPQWNKFGIQHELLRYGHSHPPMVDQVTTLSNASQGSVGCWVWTPTFSHGGTSNNMEHQLLRYEQTFPLVWAQPSSHGGTSYGFRHQLLQFEQNVPRTVEKVTTFSNASQGSFGCWVWNLSFSRGETNNNIQLLRQEHSLPLVWTQPSSQVMPFGISCLSLNIIFFPW